MSCASFPVSRICFSFSAYCFITCWLDPCGGCGIAAMTCSSSQSARSAARCIARANCSITQSSMLATVVPSLMIPPSLRQIPQSGS